MFLCLSNSSLFFLGKVQNSIGRVKIERTFLRSHSMHKIQHQGNQEGV